MSVQITRRYDSLENNKAVVHRFLRGTHSGDLAVVDELVSPDVVLHGFPGGDPRTREEYKEFFQVLNAAFPGMNFEIQATIAEGDLVAVQWLVSGTHRGPFAGVPATGRQVRFSGMVIYRLCKGRICETWLQPDTLALLQQLGAIPVAQGSV